MTQSGMRVLPKPQHLGPEYGAWFKDATIVDAYTIDRLIRPKPSGCSRIWPSTPRGRSSTWDAGPATSPVVWRHWSIISTTWTFQVE